MPHFAIAREAEGVSLKFEEGEWDMYSDSYAFHPTTVENRGGKV
jgi:hypothetical protein